MPIAELDKSVSTAVGEGYGTITIRVVVLQKGMAPAAAPSASDAIPVDVAPHELLPEPDKKPTATFLEDPKKGHQCCVFLINGQRQHAWDNQFIVRDLEFKYLRNRMIVVVDCDGLKPEAIAHLMQGSRFQFLEGTVYDALGSRVVATLKGDPDLRKLEEDAEDEISSLEAGDEAVKAALDQLIQEHHEAAAHAVGGHAQIGGTTPEAGASSAGTRTEDVVIEADSSAGPAAEEPVLAIRPDLPTIRLKPNETRKFTVYPKPESAWKNLESMILTFDPPIKELEITRTTQITGEEVALKFAEPEEFDEDEYPIETALRCTATFKAHAEARVLERRVVINRSKKRPPRPRPPLKDDPSILKVTGRQPVKIVIGGPDVHVKLRWDGKDELVTSVPPKWTFNVLCESPSVEPPTFLTRPTDGRFELLIQAAAALTAGEQLKFTINAIGPGRTLTTAFLADIVEPPSARRIATKITGGAQRRPPYALLYVKKENWKEETCWGEVWTGEDAGAFEEPSAKSPLTIFINTDMDLLSVYRETLIAKKMAETTIQQRTNKYTAHVAFHLYQMYLRQRDAAKSTDDVEPLTDAQMREEIQRVAHTLLKLMEVSQ